MAGGHNVDPGQPGGGAAGVPAQWFGDDPAVTSASSRAPGVISTSSPALRLGELLLAAERAVESAVRTSLSLSAPAIPFLGEEQGGESGVEQLWVLDPIDGTINFARDSPLCAISLSLVIDGQPVLGIVDAPLIGERFVAQHGAGVYLNGDRIEACEVSGLDEAIVGVADFKVGVGAEDENRVHLAVVGRLARESLRVRMQGSAALDLAWLAAGRLNATMMLSNLPWDVTAGLLLVREAGGLVYDYDGSDHGPTSRYTLASVPSLARPMRQLVEEAM